jgi:hypothetical protein
MKVMKTIFTLVFVSVLAASCTNYYDETTYDYRDRVIGRYSVEEYSDTFNEDIYYTMYVSKDYGSSDGIYFENFYVEGIRVYAYMNNDHITIPFQITEGYEVEGHGSYYHGEFHLNYSVYDRHSNSPTDYCSTVAYAE